MNHRGSKFVNGREQPEVEKDWSPVHPHMSEHFPRKIQTLQHVLDQRLLISNTMTSGVHGDGTSSSGRMTFGEESFNLTCKLASSYCIN